MYHVWHWQFICTDYSLYRTKSLKLKKTKENHLAFNCCNANSLFLCCNLECWHSATRPVKHRYLFIYLLHHFPSQLEIPTEHEAVTTTVFLSKNLVIKNKTTADFRVIWDILENQHFQNIFAWLWNIWNPIPGNLVFLCWSYGKITIAILSLSACGW